MSRNKFTMIFCVLAAALFGGVTAPAGAVIPVVDQYTEQFPDPGGNSESGQGKPKNPNGTNPGHGQNNSARQSGNDGDSGTVTGGSGGDLGGGSGSSLGSSGDRHETAVNDIPEETVASGDAHRETLASVDSVSSSNDGLGWLFPVLLGSVLAGVAAFMIIRKRNRGNTVS